MLWWNVERTYAERSYALRAGRRRVVQREGRGPRHCPGHVGDAVMDHPFLDIGWAIMRSRAARLKAAALIDGKPNLAAYA